MTANKRIALNVVATYGRSLYALVIGLFCGRWTLMALGEVDYGLMGVVGGLTAFIAFFNGILASALSRYYAFAVGRAQNGGAEGLEECRRWFNTGVSLHWIVPLALMFVGYPIGVWAVENFLTIPADRVADAVWVFRFVCVSCFVGMVNVPFQAMYVAKQRIAELTIYSVVTSTLNVVVLYYMVTHTGVWLAKYAGYTCCATIVPQLIIVARALVKFPECRLVWRYQFDFGRVLSLGKFAGWQLFGNLGYLVKAQGMAVLVNKLFGPTMNSAMSLAGTVSGHTDALASAMNSALSPAIANLVGAEERERALRLTYRACKFGGVLSLLFILPLSLEVHEIFRLWLKTPPPLVAEACLLTLMTVAIDEMGRGIGILVTAYGRIARYYVLLGGLNILSLPIACLVVVCGGGEFLSVFATLLVVRVIAVVLSAWLGQCIVRLSFMKWFRDVFLRISIVGAVAWTVGFGVRSLLCDWYWLRMGATFAITVIVFSLLVATCVLDVDEREAILARLPFGWAKRLLENLRFGKLIRAWHCARQSGVVAQGRRALIIPCDPDWVVGSRGDQAMITVAAAQLRRVSPQAEIDVLVSTANGVPGLELMGLRAQQDWDQPFDQWIRGYAADYGHVVVVGADVVDGVYGFPVAMKLLMFYDVFTRLGARTWCLGFSWSPRAHRLMSRMLRKLPSDLCLPMRDPISFARVQTIVGDQACRLVADAAFLLDPRETSRTRNLTTWISEIQGAGGRVLAVNVHPMFNDVDAAGDAWILSVVEALDALLQQDQTLSLLFLPHDDRPDVSDVSLLASLYEQLPEKQRARCRFQREVLWADELKAVVARCDGLVSGRMHLAIAALGSGVPVLALVYQGKFEGLWQHFGLSGETLVDPKTILGNGEGLFVRLAAFLQALPKWREILCVHLPHVLELAREGLR